MKTYKDLTDEEKEIYDAAVKITIDVIDAADIIIIDGAIGGIVVAAKNIIAGGNKIRKILLETEE